MASLRMSVISFVLNTDIDWHASALIVWCLENSLHNLWSHAVVVQNETALELATRSHSMWVLHRMKTAAISRGLDKTASLFQRTVNNPVCLVPFFLCPMAFWCRSAGIDQGTTFLFLQNLLESVGLFWGLQPLGLFEACQVHGKKSTKSQ